MVNEKSQFKGWSDLISQDSSQELNSDNISSNRSFVDMQFSQNGSAVKPFIQHNKNYTSMEKIFHENFVEIIIFTFLTFF